MTSIKKSSKYLALLLLVFLVNCSNIKLISDYDETTDKLTTEIQELVSGIFVKVERNIGTEKSKHKYFVSNYEEIQIKVSTLIIRANAIDKNQIVQQQVADINRMLIQLEELHEKGFKTIDEITPLKVGFTRAFSAIIKLQTGLKRGKTE